MTDVMPEQQAVDIDELAGGDPGGADVLDAVDEQLIARLAGRACEGGVGEVRQIRRSQLSPVPAWGRFCGRVRRRGRRRRSAS